MAISNLAKANNDSLYKKFRSEIIDYDAKGNYQLNVHKSNFLNTTTTKVKFLNSEERIDQIAKMLAGDLITKSALNHAKELLN